MAGQEYESIDKLILIYKSEHTGKLHQQFATELVEAGTLIESEGPNEGEDLEIVGYRIIE